MAGSMLIDLTDTTTGEIRNALTRARDQVGGPTTGVVLNLLIMTDESRQHDAVRAASQAGREHPCRVIAIISRGNRGTSRLDAEIRSGDGAAGQTVLLRLYGPMSLHPDSVVMPLLVPDTPVVTWWPGNGPEVPSGEPLGALAQRRVTDAAAAAEPVETLHTLAQAYRPGDTDLSWTRATPWRSLLAATLDQTDGPIHGGTVAAEEGNPTADLLVAWLSSRLRVSFGREITNGPGITGVSFAVAGGDVAITREDGRTATLSRPGQPDRHVALQRRDTADLLSEELRRLNPDEIYGETLAVAAAGVPADWQ
jgi:glucose-6-phosphate dehydrogenase assembly protein OpcA